MKEHMQVSELSFGWHLSVHVLGPLGNGTSATRSHAVKIPFLSILMHLDACGKSSACIA
jgi:hypothetical protein